MQKTFSIALLLICTAALSSVAGAQSRNVSAGAAATSGVGSANPTITRVKTSKEVTPEWTAKGTMYGFVTCDTIRNQGSKVSLDDITKCVAGGGKYTFGGNNVSTDAAEQAKLAPFAGKFAAVNVTMTSGRYGTGPTSDVAVDGLYSGGNRPATRAEMYQVVSVAADPTPDPREGAPNTGRRGAAAEPAE